jgi:hypothetical protein
MNVPPCPRCNLARLQTGLCPHCEHVYCIDCNLYLTIIEYGEHVMAAHREQRWLHRRYTALFWWEITKVHPTRCPECDAILTADGLCPVATKIFMENGGVATNDLRLIGLGGPWPARPF